MNHMPMDDALDSLALPAHGSRLQAKEESSRPTSADVSGADLAARSIELRLVQIVAECLGVDVSEVDPSNAFRYLGVDALTALTLVLKIEREFGTSMKPTVFLDGSTVRQVSDRIFLSTQ